MTGDMIRDLPESVKMICEAGTGYNNIDIYMAKSRDIKVCNVPAYSSQAVAHLVTSFVLNLSTSLSRVQLRNGFAPSGFAPHFELNGQVMGIIGASGATGKQLAPIAKALGMRVIGHTGKHSSGIIDGVQYVSKDELLAQSDFVVLLCPLTAQTHQMMDRQAFRKMKRTAFIINTARGAIIHEADLIDTLKAEEIAGAALDVQEVEPPRDDNPLLSMPNVILTPHIGWKSYESRQRLIQVTAMNIVAAAQGRAQNVVN